MVSWNRIFLSCYCYRIPKQQKADFECEHVDLILTSDVSWSVPHVDVKEMVFFLKIISYLNLKF